MSTDQLDLFSAPPTVGRTRKTDPRSSREAAGRAKVGSQRDRILVALQSGPMTADDLAPILGVHRSTVASRLAQMALERSKGGFGDPIETRGFKNGVQLWRLTVADVYTNGRL